MSVVPAIVGRRWFWVTAVLLGIAAGMWWLAANAGEEDGIEWVKVERDDLKLGVEVSGTLQAVETSSLGPPAIPRVWDFKISFMAPEGGEVRKGQPVLGFDTSDLARKLEEKIAESEAAQKEIEKKEAELSISREADRLQLAEAGGRRKKALLEVEVPESLSSSVELRAARLDLGLAEKEVAFLESKIDASRRSGEAALEALRSQRDRASARVREIREAIESMSVKAPRDGTVIYTTNWRGEKKKVGDSTWRGETVMEIPNLDRMKAGGEVDEADAARIAVGQEISFRLDAHPDQEFEGKVSFIWDTVQRKSWRNPLKVVRLDIELARTDTSRMRPGMRFRGQVETERREDALVIPIDCVFLRNGDPVVYRESLLGHAAVPVVLGKRNEKQVEVLEGLEEGDRVSRTDLAGKAGGDA